MRNSELPFIIENHSKRQTVLRAQMSEDKDWANVSLVAGGGTKPCGTNTETAPGLWETDTDDCDGP